MINLCPFKVESLGNDFQFLIITQMKILRTTEAISTRKKTHTHTRVPHKSVQKWAKLSHGVQNAYLDAKAMKKSKKVIAPSQNMATLSSPGCYQCSISWSGW